MDIDYIRVYSKDTNATAVAQDTVSSPDGNDPGLYGAITATGSSTNPSNTGTTGTPAGGSTGTPVGGNAPGTSAPVVTGEGASGSTGRSRGRQHS